MGSREVCGATVSEIPRTATERFRTPLTREAAEADAERRGETTLGSYTEVVAVTPLSYKPCGARMLCRKVGEIVVSKIIHTPDAAKQRSLVYEVLAKGRDCVDDEILPAWPDPRWPNPSGHGTYFYTGRFADMALNFPGHDDWYTINEVDAVGTIPEFTVETVKIKGAA